MSAYPRPVRDIHQIEISSRCNLRCHYCPHYPNLPREKKDMNWDTYLTSLNLVAHYVKQGTQTELSLTGIGEAMLHPQFIEAVELARATIGNDRMLTITTNGILLTDEMCKAIAPFRPSVFISLHRPEKAGLSVELAKKYGILAGVNASFAVSAFNWAGRQKNWFVSAPSIPCEYLRSGWAVVLVDGRVATCCLDADGSSTVGTVWDDPNTLKIKPWGDEKIGCKSCHMSVPNL
jgi:hypothetical protein